MCTQLKDACVIVSGHGNLAHTSLLTLLNVRHIQVGLGLGYAIDFFAGQLLLAVVIETYARPQARQYLNHYTRRITECIVGMQSNDRVANLPATISYAVQ